MPEPSNLYEVSSVLRDTANGRIAVVESLLAMTPDAITITFRIPSTSETFMVCVAIDEGTAPMRRAVLRSYEVQAQAR